MVLYIYPMIIELVVFVLEQLIVALSGIYHRGRYMSYTNDLSSPEAFSTPVSDATHLSFWQVVHSISFAEIRLPEHFLFSPHRTSHSRVSVDVVFFSDSFSSG